MKSRSTGVWCVAFLLVGGWFAFDALYADPSGRRGSDVDTDVATNVLRDAGRVMSRIAKQVSPSVVNIESVHRSALRGEVEETGSGVVVRSARVAGEYVVTNRHVIAGAKHLDLLSSRQVYRVLRGWLGSAAQ